MDIYFATAFDGGTYDGTTIGGGVGFNYFFSRYLGLGLDVAVMDDKDAGILPTARFIARYPFEDIFNMSASYAPYVYTGAGMAIDMKEPVIRLGLGQEMRWNEKFGVFTEIQYAWIGEDDSEEAADDEDSQGWGGAWMTRIGLRLGF